MILCPGIFISSKIQHITHPPKKKPLLICCDNKHAENCDNLSVAFSSSRKHLLTTLLRLQFVVLVLYFSTYFYLCNFNYSLFFVAYFLVLFFVCEGSLGLSILVSIIRSHRNDYLFII